MTLVRLQMSLKYTILYYNICRRLINGITRFGTTKLEFNKVSEPIKTLPDVNNIYADTGDTKVAYKKLT